MCRVGMAVVTFLVVVTGPLLAQETEEAAPPNMLSVSQWICPNSAIQQISEGYERYTLPVEREMVDEGSLVAAGLFFHAWADEWNVGYYRIAPGLPGLFEAVQEVNRRVMEANPELEDEPDPFAECTEHKDNIYFQGPNTAEPEGGS